MNVHARDGLHRWLTSYQMYRIFLESAQCLFCLKLGWLTASYHHQSYPNAPDPLLQRNRRFGWAIERLNRLKRGTLTDAFPIAYVQDHDNPASMNSGIQPHSTLGALSVGAFLSSM